MKRLLVIILLALNCAAVFAQSPDRPEMADTFRSSGKIYVVVAVVVIIFVGLAIYLFSIDRRLRNLEKFQKEK